MAVSLSTHTSSLSLNCTLAAIRPGYGDAEWRCPAPWALIGKERPNNGNSWACRQFSIAHPLSLSPSALVSTLGGGQICITSSGPGSFGFCLGSDREPWQETGGNLRSGYLIWVPPSVVSPLPEGLCSSQDNGEILFPGPGTSPSLLPSGPDPGSYTIPWGSPTSTSQLVMPLCRLILQRILSGICHLLAAVGPCLREGHGGRWRGKMTIWHLWKTQGWVEREDGDAVWSLGARPGQGQCKSGLMSSHNEEDQSQTGLVCRGTGF